LKYPNIKHFASQVSSLYPVYAYVRVKEENFGEQGRVGTKFLGKGFLNPPHPPLELGKCPWT
jgi:hypothetical protein